MALDWVKIKNEYISTRTSYRKLAEKYGTHKDTIAARAKAENWLSERDIQTDRIQTKARQKIVDTVAAQEADRIMRLLSISDKLAEKINKAAADLGEVYIIKRKTNTIEVDEESGELRKVEETQDVAVRGDAIVNSADVRNLATALKNIRDVAQTGKTDEDAMRKLDKLLEGITHEAKS